MALSEHEQKLLAEMEAALAVDDPRLVSTLNGKARTRQASRVLLGFMGILLGLAIIFAGLISKFVPVSILGFIVALAAAFTAISNFSIKTVKGLKGNKRKGLGLNSRLENRWDQRNNGF